MENGDIWGTDSIMSDINTHPASIHRSDFCPLVSAKLTLPLWVLTMLMPRGLCCMLLCRWSMEPWLADIVMLLSWAVGRRDQSKINSTKCFRILLYQRRCFFFFIHPDGDPTCKLQLLLRWCEHQTWTITLFFICGVQPVHCIWTLDSLLTSVQCYWVCKYVWKCISYF